LYVGAYSSKLTYERLGLVAVRVNVGVYIFWRGFSRLSPFLALNNLTIISDEDSFSQATPKIVLFQNSKGLKGAIKITEIVTGPDGHIVFSIKMQKYAH
jgi:hypothetical protein